MWTGCARGGEMFERVSWLAEIVNVVLCLHFLYGQKIKSRAATGILLVADWFVMEMVSSLYLKKIAISIVYIIIWVYIIVEFGKNLRKAVVAYILWVLLAGVYQLVACVPWMLSGKTRFSDFIVLMIQIEVLGLLCLSRKKIHQLFEIIAGKNSIVALALGGFGAYLIYQIIQYRERHGFPAEFFFPIVIFGILLSLFAYFWQQEKERRQRKELELQIHNLCEASFRELIETIRMKQHDFYNHIHTLQSLHYTVGDYEELVKEQERYCEDIKYDNRYYNLLNTRSPVISGFLYGKFMEADRQGIRIEYDIKLGSRISSVPEYVIIEIIGILWDNAIEYIKQYQNKTIKVSMKEDEMGMCISIENPVYNLSYCDINKYFENGYSEKKNHSGIGLSKIKKYMEIYLMELKVEKVEKEKVEWLKIVIDIQNTLPSK